MKDTETRWVPARPGPVERLLREWGLAENADVFADFILRMPIGEPFCIGMPDPELPNLHAEIRPGLGGRRRVYLTRLWFGVE